CFIATAPTEIYTLSLHDALPISYWLNALTAEGDPIAIVTAIEADADYATELFEAAERSAGGTVVFDAETFIATGIPLATIRTIRSEEHTSELQSLAYLVCRLLLE